MAHVLILRPEPDASALAERLKTAGHRPLVSPLLFTAACDWAMPVRPPAALALTSRQAAFAVAGRGALAGIAVYAIGPGTAAAAREAGLGPIVWTGDGRYERLLDALVAARPSPLLWLSGSEVRHDLPAQASALGLIATRAIVYRTVASALSDEAASALAGQSLDWALVTSPRLARQFADEIARLGLDIGALGLACLSETIASLLRPLAPRCLLVGDPPTLDGLLRAAQLIDGSRV